MLSHFALVILLHLLSRARLDKALTQRLSVETYRFQPFFSGRVALYRMAAQLKADGAGPIALVPDYICNIVPMALQAAEFEVLAYSTDETLEPNWDELSALISANQGALLVGASVFGSSALLDVMNDKEKLAHLRRHKAHVIIDIAQDIELRQRLPAGAEDILHAIVSFNGKSFPGAMGGGVLSARRLASPREGEMPSSRKLAICRHLIRSNYWTGRLPGRPQPQAPMFDRSTCSAFPFLIVGTDYRPAKVQVAAGLAGLMLIGRYRRRKAALLNRNAHLPMRFAEGAAYLPMRHDLAQSAMKSSRRKTKRPYATDADPNVSLRPNDVILHNKGFSDGHFLT